jgi:hypothetical protein
MSEAFTFSCWARKPGSDVWHHIIVWRDAEIGQMHVTIDNDDCLIDEKAVWDRALTPEERTALHAAGQGIDYGEIISKEK